MSWEVMKSETTKCHCGKGTMNYIMEMDYWNRVRSATEIHCPECRQRAELEAEKRRQEALRNKALYHEAKQLAMDRYLAKWLDLYSGLSKRDAWQRYTGGSGHPSLRTFYKHVDDAGGIREYMTRRFERDIKDALLKMSVEDKEIDELLSQRSEPPPLRHPYA